MVATVAFAPGEVIETVPMLPLTEADRAALRTTAFAGCIRRGPNGGAVLLLDLGSLYGGSVGPNAQWVDFGALQWVLAACSPIAPGTAVTIAP